jgi:hypothetical protein
MKIGGAIINGLALTLFLVPARAEEISVKVLQSLSTPAEVKTRIGDLTFKDGAPSDATLDAVYDNLTFTHALNTFLNSMEGVSIEAARKGFESIGVEDNEVLVFSKLMDAKSLFLTANADTVYALGVLDLTKGPMVLEVPPRLLGTIASVRIFFIRSSGSKGLPLTMPMAASEPISSGSSDVAGSSCTMSLRYSKKDESVGGTVLKATPLPSWKTVAGGSVILLSFAFRSRKEAMLVP